MCGVDLGKAALRKIGLNAIKHPVGKRHNTSSKKFSRCSAVDENAAAKEGDNRERW
jgi:dCTP diphosphatase